MEIDFIKSGHDDSALPNIWCKTVEMLVSPDVGLESIFIIILEPMYNFVLYDFKFRFEKNPIFARFETEGCNITLICEIFYKALAVPVCFFFIILG